MYMTHFYANPLSIILAAVSDAGPSLSEVLSDIHYQAVRVLPSFKRLVFPAYQGNPIDVSLD